MVILRYTSDWFSNEALIEGLSPVSYGGSADIFLAWYSIMVVMGVEVPCTDCPSAIGITSS
jgi:hypothetical protein